jgi:tetratricopeptide (TPR) repeat protein
MSLLTGLFNVLALLYVLRGVQLAVSIGRRWDKVVANPLTRAKQDLAEQAAFFISVPPSVLLHELFHALAIWAFGGAVIEFGYRVFWGYVVPAGQFTQAQEWFISLAGTLGSLLFGVGVWALLHNSPSGPLRYYGLRTLRFQIYFSLVYYPIFSLFLPIGDWRVIYDFGATPVLSLMAAVTHASVLAWFWRADRQGRFEMVAFGSEAEERRFEALAAAAEVGDTDARLRQVEAMRRGGAPHQAQSALESYLKTNPDSATAHLMLAMTKADARGATGKSTVEHAEAVLALNPDPTQAALAHQILAIHALEAGDGVRAEAEATLGLGDDDGRALAAPLRAELFALRGRALRRQGRLDEAEGEARQALALAQATGDTMAAGRYAEELDILAKHREQVGRNVPERV